MSKLDQLRGLVLIMEPMSAAADGESVSSVIFRTRAEVTVWRMASIQWLGVFGETRLSPISSSPFNGAKSMSGVSEVSSERRKNVSH